jgi:hypothetical protein
MRIIKLLKTTKSKPMIRKVKFKVIIIFILNINFMSSQTIPLYKLVMNSDIIISDSEFKHITEPISEYQSQSRIELKKINKVLKNKDNDELKDLKCIELRSDEDYYPTLNGESIMNSGFASLDGEKYFKIYFIKKVNKKYYVIGELWNNVTKVDLLSISENIKKLNEIEKITDYQKKYNSTVNWYLESNCNKSKFKVQSIFTEQFIDYYKQKKVLEDDVFLNENQKLKAKELFLKGNEDLYELIKDDFPNEVQQYYLKQLEKIKNTANKTYSEYSDFYSKASILLQKKENKDMNFINEILTCNTENYWKDTAIDLIIEYLKSN